MGRATGWLGRARGAAGVALLATGIVVMAGPPAGASPGLPAQAPPPLSITLSPASALLPGQIVQVTIDGPADGDVTLAQCVEPGQPYECDIATSLTVPAGPRPVTVEFQARNYIRSLLEPQTWVYCGTCYITAFKPFGTAPGVASAAIDVVPGPPAVAVDYPTRTPPNSSQGLVDGDTVQLRITGEREDGTGVALCDASVAAIGDVYAGPCTPPQLVGPGADPVARPFEVSVPFAANDGSTVRCNVTRCVVALSAPGGVGFGTSPRLGFGRLLDGDLSVKPADGLVDGQEVAVSEDYMNPTYDGPPFWIFPVTGHWVIAQCDAALMDGPSIYSVFANCAFVPGRGEVDVPQPGSGIDLGTAAVQASITSILGNETDCRAWTGACVLALVRVGQTGTVSAEVAPLTFA